MDLYKGISYTYMNEQKIKQNKNKTKQDKTKQDKTEIKEQRK